MINMSIEFAKIWLLEQNLIEYSEMCIYLTFHQVYNYISASLYIRKDFKGRFFILFQDKSFI